MFGLFVFFKYSSDFFRCFSTLGLTMIGLFKEILIDVVNMFLRVFEQFQVFILRAKTRCSLFESVGYRQNPEFQHPRPYQPDQIYFNSRQERVLEYLYDSTIKHFFFSGANFFNTSISTIVFVLQYE